MTSFLQHVLVSLMCRTARFPEALRRPLHRLFGYAYGKTGTQPYQYFVHGRWVWFNGGSAYPMAVAKHPFLNAVLVECVAAANGNLKRPIVMIDVGAAIGDTLMLIEERCAGMVRRHFCVEAAPAFLDLLKRNTATLPGTVIIPRLLASKVTAIPSLVHTHHTTAAAVGEGSVEAVPLDSLPELADETTDVLKVDVDGYDGEVLAGAKAILRRDRPLVVFEWHPVLWNKTGKDLYAVFDVLREAGYDRLLWFHNAGEFSHFTANVEENAGALRELARFLVAENAHGDPHFDIVALHKDSIIDPVQLAQLPHTRQWLEKA